MSNNLHWKARFQNPLYLGVYSLYENGATEPQKITLTIKGYEVRDIVGDGGKVTKGAHVMTFIETDKALILRPTNMKRIAAALKTPITDQWLGKKIVLRHEMDKVPGEGTSDVLRVSADAADYAHLATSKEVMNAQHEKWGAMIEAVRAGKATIDLVRGKYEIDAATLAEISRLTVPQEGGENEAV